MKAWLVTNKYWPDMRSIIAAPTRGKAIRLEFRSATDAGYKVDWTGFRAVRAPEFDEEASKIDHEKCIGWASDGPFGPQLAHNIQES